MVIDIMDFAFRLFGTGLRVLMYIRFCMKSQFHSLSCMGSIGCMHLLFPSSVKFKVEGDFSGFGRWLTWWWGNRNLVHFDE